jgi:hypothetical protein
LSQRAGEIPAASSQETEKEPQIMKTSFVTATLAAFALLGATAIAQTPSNTPPRSAMPATPNGSKADSPSANATPVTALSDAKTRLASATVKDSQGTAVGRVQSVETGSGGMVQAVRVALGSGKQTVSIPASSLSYDSVNVTVRASMTRTEIDSLPKSSQSSY